MQHASARFRFQAAVVPSLGIGLVVLAAAFLGDTVIAALACGCVALVLLPFAPWLLAPFLAALLGLCVLLNEAPLHVGGIRLYGADGLLFFLAAAAPYYLWLRTSPSPSRVPVPRGERRILLLLLLLALWGIAAMAYGFFYNHHEARDTLGAYRRYCFYPLALLVPGILYKGQNQMKMVEAAIAVGCLLIIMTGAYRLATGQTYNPQHFVTMATEPSPRLLGYIECATLAVGLAYFAGILSAPSPAITRSAATVLGLAATLFLLFSGWRLAVGLAALAPFMSVVAMTRLRGGNILKMAWAATLGVIALCLVALSAVVVFPEKASDTQRRFIERVVSFDIKNDARYYIWKQAFSEFVDSPLIGSGFGRQSLVFIHDSEGSFIGQKFSTHSTFVGMLAEAGIIGFTLLSVFHASFVLYAGLHLRHVELQFRPLAVGIFVGYLCLMGFSFLQPMQTGAIVSLSLLMGFLLVLCRKEPRTEDAVGQEASPQSNGSVP